MLTVYAQKDRHLVPIAFDPATALPESAVWIDLFQPTPGEDALVERLVGVAVPTRAEMQEIEVSSRLYFENGARYMTATLMCQSETTEAHTAAVSFILSGHRLVTVRYDAPRPFELVAAKLGRSCPDVIDGEYVMVELFESIIDRMADILEKVGADVDQVSRAIFQQAKPQDRSHVQILAAIGRKGDLTSNARESLLTIARLLLFLATEAEGMRWAKDRRAQLKSMQRDVGSLTDHATYLSGKITFLLDALLGVVGIEQNNIIKLFSVMAVVLMPPTLIASIYGMNFKTIPELELPYGYPLALVMMVAAAVLPYVLFKWKRWL